MHNLPNGKRYSVPKVIAKRRWPWPKRLRGAGQTMLCARVLQFCDLIITSFHWL